MIDYLPSRIVTLVVILTLTFSDLVRPQLPDFSGDRYTEDYVTISPFVNTVRDLRYENEDKPDHCRNDLCLEDAHNTPRRGSFTWIQTTVGYRQYVRCPYSVVDPVYGYRTCVLSNDNGTMVTEWDEPEVKQCPQPPLTEVLIRLQNGLQDDKHLVNRESWYQEAFSDILDTVRTYPDQPLYVENMQNVSSICQRAIEEAVRKGEALSPSLLDVTFRTIDWLMETNKQHFRGNGLYYYDKVKLIWMLTVITEMLPAPPVDVDYALQGHAMSISIETKFADATQERHFGVYDRESTMATKTTVHVGGEGPKVVRLLFLATPQYIGSVLFHGTWLLTTYAADYPDYPEIYEADYTDISLGLTGPILYVSLSRDPDESWSVATWIQRLSRTNDVSVTYAMQPEDGVYAHSMDYDYQSSSEDEAQKCGNRQPIVNASAEDFRLEDWYGTPCDILDYSPHNVTTCQCNSTGYFGVFGPLRISLGDFATSWLVRDTPHMKTNSMAVFLGFPYVFELYVVSHVLRAVSLVCLLATVASFTIFRKCRRGTPTKILLNLCSSLLALLVMLYVSEAIANTRNGCRISNALRYYLIMVSLLWNGVEAVNMYLMLIKVFNHDIRHFVSKAAGVAWGLPVLLVAVVLAVSVKGFDGIYTQSCDFRCQLKKPVLYYAYILPMSIILLHNVIVFIMVLKVLLKKRDSKGSKGHRGNHWMRLCGAVSIMVLLGMSWLFSAFGAIDASKSSSSLKLTEGIFHGVFVVCVNLQGVFIFIFHCARNAEIRGQWKSTVSRTQSSSLNTSSSRRSEKSSTSYTKPDAIDTKL